MGLILRPQQQGEILMPRLQQEGQQEETSQQEHPPEHPLEHPLQETSPQEHQQLEEPSQQEHPQETSQQEHPLQGETSLLVELPRQMEIIQTVGNRQLLQITQQHGRAQPRQIQQRFLPANASTRVAVLSTTVGANVSTSLRSLRTLTGKG